jgi:hypothetical protein
MSYSWFLDPAEPFNSMSYPTQATPFGMSNLASSSGSMLALDPGSQELHLYPMAEGNRQLHNLYIVDQDKSPLGTSVRARMAALNFTAPNPRALTTPNNRSLSRSNQLKS